VKLIVFDFDGTLVDSRALILACRRAVFTEFQLPLPLPQRDGSTSRRHGLVSCHAGRWRDPSNILTDFGSMAGVSDTTG
jgi:beta-phosphoglucomutase-like phosphatase (HAD superfamily)